jgi:apolipoprotein N-acyltransferase
MLYALAGAALAATIGWGANLVVAPWLAPALLIRSARASGWRGRALLWPLLALAQLAALHGRWPMPLASELVFAALSALPLLGAVLADAILAPRLRGVARTLVFPCAWAAGDYLFAFFPNLGDVFSPAPTQLAVLPLAALASVTGLWGVTFLLGWFAAVAQEVADGAPKEPAIAFGTTLVAALAYGSFRSAPVDHDVPTVKIAGITVPHPRSYHDDIVDRGVPREEVARYAPEMRQIEEALFAESARAAAAGAEVVFWSEHAAPMYADGEAAFEARSRQFAREHGVFFVPTALVMRHDGEISDNLLLVVDPQGEIRARYDKTKTWYPTDSDGVIDLIDAPWGRFAAIICFDLDFPGFVRQARDADVLLVPGFDTREVSPYHTEAGLMRAIEYGFSVVRHVNDGTSMAMGPTGRTLGLQDHFATAHRTWYVDVPTRGRRTVYDLVGDAFAWACMVGLVGLGLRARNG